MFIEKLTDKELTELHKILFGGNNILSDRSKVHNSNNGDFIEVVFDEDGWITDDNSFERIPTLYQYYDFVRPEAHDFDTKDVKLIKFYHYMVNRFGTDYSRMLLKYTFNTDQDIASILFPCISEAK